jgi:hypothetical protein
VAVCTFVSLIYWCLSAIGRPNQRSFINRYLRIRYRIYLFITYFLSTMCSDSLTGSRNDQLALSNFVHHMLRPDGVFILRMVEKNAGDLVTVDIIHELWVKFLEVSQ